MREPVVQAGAVMFARRGIVCGVRAAQPSVAAVRGRIVRRDIWGGAPKAVMCCSLGYPVGEGRMLALQPQDVNERQLE
jgi:hypothetical protein